MKHRTSGLTQEAAAAKTGISIRSGRRIEKGHHGPREEPRVWRTRVDPLAEVWTSELEPLLAKEPSLTGLTLLEYLDDNYPGRFSNGVLRTLQRRVRQWSALYGPDKTVMFSQQAVAGQQGFSDFTHPNTVITVAGQPFDHLLYQFRLAFSGWRSVLVTRGGESYSALADGLQRAMRQAGGSPRDHRTDSLSAARNNRTNVWTDDYEALCKHFGMTPTRNNLGVSHENGIVEAAHGSFKRRLDQAMKLRGSTEFATVAEYQGLVDKVARRLNGRVKARFAEEQQVLQPLPAQDVAAYQWRMVAVTRSATIEVKRCLYTVPARLVGQRLGVRIYHDQLKLYVDHTLALTLPRVYPRAGQSRARNVDYRHLIHALAAKPQAFRYSQLRDELLPSRTHHALWAHVDQQLPAQQACKWIVTVLRLGYEYDCESLLASELLARVEQGKIPTLADLQARFLPAQSVAAMDRYTPNQHTLGDYDALLTREPAAEVYHG
jgi:hypothetical protein